MIEGIPVNTLSARPTPSTATFIRERLPLALSPAEALSRLASEPMPFALTGLWAGGGAILGSEPVAVPGQDEDPFALLDDLPVVGGIAPPPPGAVGGGWFGWLGYRLGARVERVPAGPPRPVAMPDFHLAYYDHVLRLDAGGQWWFEALATPERRSELDARRRHLQALLDGEPPPVSARVSPLRLDRAAARHHIEAVAACRTRIAAGEIFQANLCVRLDGHWDGSAAELLARALRHVQPAHGASFDTPLGAIASLSPELFLRRVGDEVITAPIKGTAPRDADPAVAAAALAQLEQSNKDAAEHVMIVDLMRNDLGRVSAYGTVTAPRHPTPEAHPGVWHLVSHVRGRLRPGVGNGDVLRATFPPGSVTGAPKVQALRVIAESELTAREVYTGAIGYASPVSGLELSVAIRTLELRDHHLWLGVGGGIVADSDPEAELEEALVKARPVAGAVGSSVVVEPRAA
jgi:para-aminobenzoate synthetase / 4-amino-4-deoxychorismate lyase